MLPIIKRTNLVNTTYRGNRKIEYIVIHYTAGVTSKAGTALNVANMFSNASRQASADFIVDDGTIVQYNPDPRNRYTWAVGGNKYNNKGGSLYGKATNANTISVEICSTNGTGKMTEPNDVHYSFTAAVLDKAVELIRSLMTEYIIDAAHVIRHYDVNGKPCPGVMGWNAESGYEWAWQDFHARLSKPLSNSEYVEKLVKAGLINSPDYWTQAMTDGASGNNVYWLIRKVAERLRY